MGAVSQVKKFQPQGTQKFTQRTPRIKINTFAAQLRFLEVPLMNNACCQTKYNLRLSN